MNKKVIGLYKFQTASNLIKIEKTWSYLTKQKDKQALVLSPEDEQMQVSEEDVLRKFSDKRIKKIQKLKTERQKRKGQVQIALQRFVLPILFLSPEGKTVIRKCKVLNVREDKKYEHLSKHQWETQYNEMLPFTVFEEDGKLRFITNPVFSLEQFEVCGGIVNSKFWDINLRYAQNLRIPDSEVYTMTINKITEYLSLLHEAHTSLPRYEEIKKE